MALQSNIQIYISGTPITAIKEFTLHQSIGQHHYFELVCRMDVIEKGILGGIGAGSGLGDEAKNFLGEPISVQVMSSGVFTGYKELEFKGVVTGVNSFKAFNHKSGDVVVISGHSGSIISDDGPHYASHSDASLVDILEKTFVGYDTSKLKTSFVSKNTEPIHYTVQHKESSWQYAQRLAAQYSEWFFYDGKKLVFGLPDDDDAVVLKYGSDLQEFSMKLQPEPNNFKYFTNDYLTNEQHTKTSTEIATPSGYNGFASEKSATLFAKETNVWVNGYTDPQLKKRLDTQVEQQKKAADQRQVIVKGTSDNPGVGIGKVISLVGETENYGSFRVIKVMHRTSENGSYQNKFEAVSAEMDVYPLTDFNAIPTSETQTAVVTGNGDPAGIGRITVQFPWQKMLGETTPWLRIVSPHAGGDKGFHFIPEVGEEVLIGFEGGNAERPYVMGSLYNGGGKAGAFQNADNDIKALQTRSGNKVVMNDRDGSITMADPSGNVVTLLGNGGILIQAPNKITLASKDIEISAGNSVSITAQPNEEGGGEGTISMTAQKSFSLDVLDETIDITAKQDMAIESTSGSATINAKIDAEMRAKDVTIAAITELKCHGGTKNTISGGEVAVNKG